MVCQLRNPVIAGQLLVFLRDIAARRYILRSRKPIEWYPTNVRHAVESLVDSERTTLGDCEELNFDVPLGPTRLRLALGYLIFETRPDWSAQFTDDEQYVSLHRWNWLLRAFTDEPSQPHFAWGCDLMQSWILTMSPLPEGLASESYTVGERISNACLYARVAGGSWHALPDKISQALLIMAYHLARHLEYYGDEATGNHALNNARALYFAGICLSRPDLAHIARLIIVERLQVLVTTDGFLREGSSHYHLLFCRWLIEVRQVALECGDGEMLSLLDPVLPKLVKRCWFFVVPSRDGSMHLPTIGDVSPDFDPTWLLSMLWSAPALACYAPEYLPPNPNHVGWGNLWMDRRQETGKREGSELENEVCWQSWQASGWHRLDWQGWTAIWHAESAAGPALASHAHHDLCSLVLYHRGREVLIDPGRHNYDRWGELGNYGMYCISHNSVCLDDIAPMLSRRDRLFMHSYRSGMVCVSGEPKDGQFLVTIEHDGFMRLAGGGVKHRRTFAFSRDRIEIEDTFAGRGCHQLDIFFQWAESPEIQPVGGELPVGRIGKSRYQIESDLGGIRDFQEEFFRASLLPLAGWRFPAYGMKEPCVTQIIRGAIKLPASCRHVISTTSE